MSVVYRDRERGRYDDDNRTTVSARTAGGSKVTRYIIKEDDYKSESGRKSKNDDTRSRADDSRSNYGRGYDDREEIRIIRKERDTAPVPQREYREEPRYTREEITIRRDESPKRRDEYWRRPPGEEVQDRELVIRRTVDRDDDRGRAEESMAITKVDDRRDSRFSDYEVINSPRKSLDEREREVQRYIRTSEYYAPQPPQAPQTIIIRQEPIIIRERVRDRSRDRRDEDYQIVKKSDVDDEKSVTTARSTRTKPRDEEYFYEKKVRERLPPPDDDRRSRREISPGDSVSQVGRRNARRSSSDDDTMVYVRKEKIEEGYESDDGHRGRDLAAGALAGIGAAELFRNHNQKEGKEASRGVGRVARDAGAGVVGVVAAEAIRRYRSKSRRRSRSRSDSRGRYKRRGSESESRSRSHSRIKTIGAFGLAGAAVLAGAVIANRSTKNNQSPDRGSRSRSRGGSRSRSRRRSESRASQLSELENDPNATNSRNPRTRNARVAAAGAVGAAAAALWEQHRNKEDDGSRERSRSRVRQALPVVATGLGTAALAGLFERNKAKREAETIAKEEDQRARSRSRSRSRPRTDSTYYDGPRRATFSDPGLIEYGAGPMYGNNYGAGYYGRPNAPENDYYNNNTRDIVPAPTPAPNPNYGDREARPRSPSRSRARSLSSDRDRRSHSRRRSRDGAVAAAAAVGAGVAASEYDARRKEKKDRKRRSRQRSREQSYTGTDPYNGRDPYEDANWHATHSASFAQQGDPYATQSGFYPQGGQYPPPPGSMPSYNPPQQYQQQPSYGPQNFPPPPPGHPQSTNYDPYAPNQNPYAPRPHGADENVSAEHVFPAPSNQHRQPSPDGLDATARDITAPVINVQRPSTSTEDSRSGSNFPGSNPNPFHPQSQEQHTTPFPGVPSPRYEPGSRTRDTSTAADVSTPLPNEHVLVHDIVTRSPSGQSIGRPQGSVPLAQPTPQNPYLQQTYNVASPTTNGRSSAAARYTPVNQPTPRLPTTANNTIRGDRAPRERSVTPTRSTQATFEDPRATAFQQPEMTQTNRDRIPFMPSPDIRPPSNDSLPRRSIHDMYPMKNSNTPSMPNLTIPQPFTQRPPQTQQSASSYVPPTEQVFVSADQRQPRSRSPGTPAASTTPTNEKRVSFAPKPEFSEAPKIPNVEPDDADLARHRQRERPSERANEKDGDRDRDRDRRQHDGGRRDYDAGDDFSDDTPFEYKRRKSHDRGGGERDRDGGQRKRSSRRERTDAQSPDREADSNRDRDRNRDDEKSTPRTSSRRKRDGSPSSDTTVDLPERFNSQGRKKQGNSKSGQASEQDTLTESIGKLLGGKGLGDVLGNLLGGGDDKDSDSGKKGGGGSGRSRR